MKPIKQVRKPKQDKERTETGISNTQNIYLRAIGKWMDKDINAAKVFFHTFCDFLRNMWSSKFYKEMILICKSIIKYA